MELKEFADNFDPNVTLRVIQKEEIGMTNAQYKGMLLDELENWMEMLEMAEKFENEKIKAKAQKQVDKINEKLKFIVPVEEIGGMK